MINAYLIVSALALGILLCHTNFLVAILGAVFWPVTLLMVALIGLVYQD
jgi:hypothetical protein